MRIGTEQMRGASTAVNYIALFCFSLWPAINFIAENLDMAVEYGLVLGLGLTTFALAVGVFHLGTSLAPGQPKQRIAAVVAVATTSTFWVQLARALATAAGSDVSVLALWFALFAATVTLAWLVITDDRRMLVLATVGAVALLTAAVDAIGQALTAAPIGAMVGAAGPASKRAVQRRPDVYYVLVDAYARADQLRRYTGFDNSAFIRTLEDRGFRVLGGARSNYFFTDLSFPSLLSMRYLVTDVRSEVESFRDVLPIFQGENPVITTFRSLDYSIVVSGSKLCSDKADRCIVRNLGVPKDAWEFLRTTPFPVALSYLSSDLYGKLSRHGVPALDGVTRDVSMITASPVFLLSHITEVHDGVYNTDCSFRTKLSQDDLKRMNFTERMVASKPPYLDSVVCINRLLTQLVDTILAKSADPIIVIAADHGSNFSRSSTSETAWIDPEERTAVFSAWRLPKRCASHIYDTMSNVNHFRAIIACVTGEEPQFLEDIAYAGWSYTGVKRLAPR